MLSLGAGPLAGRAAAATVGPAAGFYRQRPGSGAVESKLERPLQGRGGGVLCTLGRVCTPVLTVCSCILHGDMLVI